MHKSVMKFLEKSIRPKEVAGKTVLEVGSRNINGSPREIIEPMGPAKYIGLDSEPGPGVDVPLPVEGVDIVLIGHGKFDLVVSTEMLEHAKNWRLAVSCMKSAVKPGGILIVTTRGPGYPRHEYPSDYWRFTVADFRKIFADMEVEILVDDPMPDHPGVFLRARARPEVDLDSIEVEKAP